MGLTWFCPCLYYLWCMLNIGSGPSSFRTGDTKNTFRLFWIPFCAGIENPFEFHGLFGISEDIARNTNSFPGRHAVNILLIWPTIRFICNKNAKKSIFIVFLYLFGICTPSRVPLYSVNTQYIYDTIVVRMGLDFAVNWRF